jgi:eukaryotic-like serine/threonine-protein kinase
MVTPAQRALTAAQVTSPQSGLVALGEQALEMPFKPGDLIAGKYEIIKLIGTGGMGYVVSALHVELGEVVALKFLRPEALQIEELVERFAREARAAAKIRSEHVARVFDVGVLPDGVPFIVMEHLAGQDLAELLQARGPLPIKVAVEYVMQACEALAAAHAAGVIHRDIKPENLFLTTHAQGLDFIKILDFGISKVALAPGKRGFVRTMLPLGSPVYMSPEQIRSSEQVDARTDIWSLGCVLFELLTGTVAFNEPTLMQLSAAILEHDPVPLRELLPEAPEELEAVVLRCLEKDADKRYGNIAELAIALYPFAPRRSRISAERCYHALKNAGVDCPEFEIQSVFPPSLTDMPAVSSAAPRTHTSPKLRPGTPPPVSVAEVSAAEMATLRPSNKYKFAGLAALVVLAAAAAALLFQSHSADVTHVSAAKADSAPATRKAAPEIDLDALSPAVAPGALASASSAASAAGSAAHSQHAGGATLRRAPSPPVTTKPGVTPRKHDEELDVGY